MYLPFILEIKKCIPLEGQNRLICNSTWSGTTWWRYWPEWIWSKSQVVYSVRNSFHFLNNRQGWWCDFNWSSVEDKTAMKMSMQAIWVLEIALQHLCLDNYCIAWKTFNFKYFGPFSLKINSHLQLFFKYKFSQVEATSFTWSKFRDSLVSRLHILNQV